MEVLLAGRYPISPRITLGLPNKLSRVKKVGILDHTNCIRKQFKESNITSSDLGFTQQAILDQ